MQILDLKVMPFLLFALISVGHILAVHNHHKMWLWFTKPLLMPVLALGYAQNASEPQMLILMALGLSFVGDTALLFSGPRSLLAGLGAFLAGHLCYSAWFMQELTLPIPPGIWFGVVFYIAYGLWIYHWLNPSLTGEQGGMKGPVLVYLVVILSMSFLSLVWARRLMGMRGLAVLGSWLFVFSDTLIAHKDFVSSHDKQLPTLETWIMVTYILAQTLLILGITF